MAGKYVSLQLHLIWSTAHREPLISRKWRNELYGYLGGVVASRGGSLLSAGGTSDHVHACVAMPMTVTVAHLVHAMKSSSSRWMLENRLGGRGYSWQKGYGAFGVAKSSEADLCQYIRDQEEHHRMWTFQQEFLSLLRLHKIDYDPQSLWD